MRSPTPPPELLAPSLNSRCSLTSQGPPSCLPTHPSSPKPGHGTKPSTDAQAARQHPGPGVRKAPAVVPAASSFSSWRSDHPTLF